uniref:Remorin C-terminal domain-containing protein n=1 Tax=Kalanchoe fedtschenkoi TaxID=63787 RepID=A0A7N0VIW9_KALFE
MQQDSTTGLSPESRFSCLKAAENQLTDSLAMKASDASPPILGTFPSPGSPNFLDTSLGYTRQGWSSERVPLSSCYYGKRRPTNLSSMLPHHSGRTVPSKWEDAERWITSPSSNSFLTNKRPMSRSGPIAQSKTAYFSNYSPNFQGFQSGKDGYSLALHRSPISSGQMLESMDHSQMKNENGTHLAAGLSGLSDLRSESSDESSQDAKLEQYVDGEVSKRDMATQMSPVTSNSSSSKGCRHSAAEPPSRQACVDESSKKLEEKDVQIDKWATVLRWSKKHGGKLAKRDPPEAVEMYKATVAQAQAPSAAVAPASPWDVAALEKKYEREEAKITAWQNLQKAKTEAAVRKLEMKLERKRSESMDKIIKKFKKAEKQSQKMRRLLAEEKARSAHHDEAPKWSLRVSPSPVSIHVGSFSCCFTCHAL